MGQLNTENGKFINNQFLKTGICIFCERKRAIPADLGPSNLTFDYICRSCNPNVIISITETVLMTNLLDLLKGNPEARNRFRDELIATTAPVFKVDSHILNYFLGYTSTQTITYAHWMEGNITGNIRNWYISPEDLKKIEQEQRAFFERRVSEKLNQLKSNFAERKQESSDVRYMIAQELDTVNNILIRGRHKFDHKPVANEGVIIGTYKFRNTQVLEALQTAYELSIAGTLDYSIVPSEKQKIGVASMTAQFSAMIDAVAFIRFRQYIEDRETEPVETTNNNKNFSAERIHELELKIDEIKEILIKSNNENKDNQTTIHNELQLGQQVIFDSLDELKELLPAVKKKSWYEMAGVKLMLLIGKKIITEEVGQKIFEQLKDTDIDIENLLNK